MGFGLYANKIIRNSTGKGIHKIEKGENGEKVIYYRTENDFGLETLLNLNVGSR